MSANPNARNWCHVTRLAVVAGAAVVLTATASPVSAQASGSVSGTFTAGGATATLRHAYAQLQKDDSDAAKTEIHLFLTDVPLSPEALDDWWVRTRMAREGKLRGVELVIDAATRQPDSALLYHKAFSGTMSVSGSNRLEAKAFTKNLIAGRVFLPRTTDSQNRPLAYDVTFRTAIRPLPVPTFTGEAARNSAPAKAALAFFAACRAGNVAAIKAYLPPAQIAQDPEAGG